TANLADQVKIFQLGIGIDGHVISTEQNGNYLDKHSGNRWRKLREFRFCAVIIHRDDGDLLHGVVGGLPFKNQLGVRQEVSFIEHRVGASDHAVSQIHLDGI